MKFTGVIQGLIRERHPFAVLAILAALLPSVLIAAGLHGGAGRIRLADGTFVICTGHGFARIADPAGTGEHDTNDCCKSGCIHVFSKIAIGPAPVAVPVRFAAVVAIAWPNAGETTRHDPLSTGFPIRAPPVASA
jgi:hypothetical protein